MTIPIAVAVASSHSSAWLLRTGVVWLTVNSPAPEACEVLEAFVACLATILSALGMCIAVCVPMAGNRCTGSRGGQPDYDVMESCLLGRGFSGTAERSTCTSW